MRGLLVGGSARRALEASKEAEVGQGLGSWKEGDGEGGRFLDAMDEGERQAG